MSSAMALRKYTIAIIKACVDLNNPYCDHVEKVDIYTQESHHNVGTIFAESTWTRA